MDYEAFKTQILKLTTIDLNAYKEKQMKRRIDSLIKKNNYDTYDDYVSALKTNNKLYDEFINYLTINVSEFFRNPEQWEVLSQEVFPELLKKEKNLKIWSAACSTGDEPYTLAMVLSRHVPLGNIKILATDIDNEVINRAKTGIYSGKSIKCVPSDLVNKYFEKIEDDSYKIKDEIKRCVEFKKHDLLKDEYTTNCDLIVCRNVLIYFTENAKNIIYSKFCKSLKKDGILFVGCTEQIIMANNFNLKTSKTYFYVKNQQ